MSERSRQADRVADMDWAEAEARILSEDRELQSITRPRPDQANREDHTLTLQRTNHPYRIKRYESPLGRIGRSGFLVELSICMYALAFVGDLHLGTKLSLVWAVYISSILNM